MSVLSTVLTFHLFQCSCKCFWVVSLSPVLPFSFLSGCVIQHWGFCCVKWLSKHFLMTLKGLFQGSNLNSTNIYNWSLGFGSQLNYVTFQADLTLHEVWVSRIKHILLFTEESLKMYSLVFNRVQTVWQTVICCRWCRRCLENIILHIRPTNCTKAFKLLHNSRLVSLSVKPHHHFTKQLPTM